MKKARSKSQSTDRPRDLWINPGRNIRGIDGDRAWDNRGNITPNSGARFLELADVALGLKKPEKKRKRSVIG